MTEEQQLNLQAFLDGELPEAEARAVAAWVARDEAATRLLGELRHTRNALLQGWPEPKLPESREFFWSKIERQIQRLEPAAPPSEPLAWLRRLRRVLVPVGAGAALLVALTFTMVHLELLRPSTAPDTEMASADTETFTYHDYANGTTLVWLGYPAER
jgi:anti-sigma factor RsiW